LKEEKKESVFAKETRDTPGEPPVAVPEGELVCVEALVEGKTESPFLFKILNVRCTKEAWKSKGRSGVAVVCSKRW
jgi:hypothetical protein